MQQQNETVRHILHLCNSVTRLCEISPQEQMTVIDDDLMNDLDAMDNVDMPIIDDDGMDKAYELEYEVSSPLLALPDQKRVGETNTVSFPGDLLLPGCHPSLQL